VLVVVTNLELASADGDAAVAAVLRGPERYRRLGKLEMQLKIPEAFLRHQASHAGRDFHVAVLDFPCRCARRRRRRWRRAAAGAHGPAGQVSAVEQDERIRRGVAEMLPRR